MANEEKIRILDEQPAENAGSLLYIRTLAGSSDASKPTSLLANGSVFIETDTGKVYIFDEDDGWTEMQAGGGGGGGGEKFVVTLTPTLPDFSGTMDKTPEEITAAYEAGQEIEFDLPSLSVKAKAMEFAVNDGIIQAGAIVTYRDNGSHMLIEILTHSTASEYFTSIYSLTPAS